MFQGFTKETYEFLFLLKMHNEKAYFEANREVFQNEVMNPLKALVEELGEPMLAIDPLFDVRPKQGVISRVYRDTRFSRDKSPFRDHMWISFKYPKQRVSQSCGMFFEISPDGCRSGFGMYGPDKPRMDALRSKIAANPPGFETIVTNPKMDRFMLNTEPYKRLLKDDLPQITHQYYNSKCFSLMHPITIEQTYSHELVDLLLDDFNACVPLYEYTKEAFSVLLDAENPKKY